MDLKRLVNQFKRTEKAGINPSPVFVIVASILGAYKVLSELTVIIVTVGDHEAHDLALG